MKCFILIAFIGTLLALGCRKTEKPHVSAALEFLLGCDPIPVSVSPDRKYVLLKQRMGNSFEIIVEEAGSGRRLFSYRSADSQLSLTWRPNSREIVFVSDHSGDEKFSLYDWHLTEKRVSLVHIPEMDTAAPPLRWSLKGDKLVAQVRTGNTERLICITYGADGAESFKDLADVCQDTDFEISCDGRYIAFVPQENPCCVRVSSLLDCSTQSVDRVVCNEGGQIRGLSWSPDEKSILCTNRSEKDQFFKLSRIDLKSNKCIEILHRNHDLQHPVMLLDGLGAVVEENCDGLNRIILLNRKLALTSIFGGKQYDTRFLGMSQGGSKMICSRSGRMETTSLVEYNMRSVIVADVIAGKVSVFTEKNLRAFETRAYTSDGLSVHLSVWNPRRPQLGIDPSAVIFVHGGPNLQQRPTPDQRVQYLIKTGVTFCSVNYRGSSGYGKEYEEVSNPADQAQDVAASIIFVSKSLGIPLERIVVLAESYGSVVAIKALPLVGRRIGALVLVSPLDIAEVRCPLNLMPTIVRVYVGENDILSNRFDIRTSLSFCCGSDFNETNSRSIVHVKAEGHQLRQASSAALVCDAIVEAIASSRPLSERAAHGH